MSKSNKALKNEIQIKEKRKASVGTQTENGSKKDPRVEASLKTWKEEIEGLKKEQFQSMELAAKAVAERVTKRMMLTGLQQSKAIEFITDVLSTDPVASDYLRKALKISE